MTEEEWIEKVRAQLPEISDHWESLGIDERDTIIKYMKLLKWYNQDPSKISYENKKWILENSNCRTYLLPVEIMNKYRIN